MWRGVGIVGSMCTLSRICTEPSGLGDAFLKATSRAADPLLVQALYFTWLTKYKVFWWEFPRGGRKSPREKLGGEFQAGTRGVWVCSHPMSVRMSWRG